MHHHCLDIREEFIIKKELKGSNSIIFKTAKSFMNFYLYPLQWLGNRLKSLIFFFFALIITKFSFIEGTKGRISIQLTYFAFYFSHFALLCMFYAYLLKAHMERRRIYWKCARYGGKSNWISSIRGELQNIYLSWEMSRSNNETVFHTIYSGRQRRQQRKNKSKEMQHLLFHP